MVVPSNQGSSSFNAWKEGVDVRCPFLLPTTTNPLISFRLSHFIFFFICTFNFRTQSHSHSKSLVLLISHGQHTAQKHAQNRSCASGKWLRIHKNSPVPRIIAKIDNPTMRPISSARDSLVLDLSVWDLWRFANGRDVGC
jgi:hypothetical protein